MNRTVYARNICPSQKTGVNAIEWEYGKCSYGIVGFDRQPPWKRGGLRYFGGMNVGIAEAKADGVRYERRGYDTMFYPRCFFCLKEVARISYISKRHYVCSKCKPQIKLFKEYYDDHESKNLFEAISRKADPATNQSCD